MTIATGMDDITFLDSVITELDRGWIRNEMCNDTGKCLVGAGTAVLGWRYLSEVEQETMYDLNGHDAFLDFIASQEKAEREAGARLYGLLLKDSVDFESDPEAAVIDDPELATEVMTSFNDDFSDYSELRPKLVAKLEELRSVE